MVLFFSEPTLNDTQVDIRLNLICAKTVDKCRRNDVVVQTLEILLLVNVSDDKVGLG